MVRVILLRGVVKALGLGIGIGLASRRPRAWTPADAGASLASWMRGDDAGAAINTTPTPHQYAAIPDRGALGGQYAQATSASQPQVSTLWAPGPAPLFDGGAATRALGGPGGLGVSSRRRI